MPLPQSVIKIKKGEVEFISDVDKSKYLLAELTRAALRDVGKYICNGTRRKIKRRTGKLAKNTQYWARKKDLDLQVGFKPGGFYGGFQELGTEKMPKIAALTSTVEENIDMIRIIEGQYLSAIEDENKALGLISEEDYEGE